MRCGGVGVCAVNGTICAFWRTNGPTQLAHIPAPDRPDRQRHVQWPDFVRNRKNGSNLLIESRLPILIDIQLITLRPRCNGVCKAPTTGRYQCHVSGKLVTRRPRSCRFIVASSTAMFVSADIPRVATAIVQVKGGSSLKWHILNINQRCEMFSANFARRFSPLKICCIPNQKCNINF